MRTGQSSGGRVESSTTWLSVAILVPCFLGFWYTGADRNERVVDMTERVVTMLGGLGLAIGMGVLLLVWLDRGEGAGITGFLFMLGVAAGIAVVIIGAMMRHNSD